MKKHRLPQLRRTHRIALRVGLFAVWLGLVICLPKKSSNLIATAGLIYGSIKWAERVRDAEGDGSDGHPNWGCFLGMRMHQTNLELDRIIAEMERKMTPEQKAELANMKAKQELVRPAEREAEPEQELLRPAADVGKTHADELLRSNDEQTGE